MTVTCTVNVAPVLSGIETAPLPYPENGIGLPSVSDTITVTDANDTNLESAVVKITAGFVAGDDLLFSGVIPGDYDETSGVLTLTGSTSKAAWQQVLRSIRFRNLTSDDPGTSRTISFTVNDGSANSNTVSRSIAITEQNDPPALTTTPGTVSANAQVPTVIDGGITVTDPDSSMISAATVSIAVGFQSQDVLTLPGQPLPSGITASQTGQVLELTGTATVASYQAALRSVTYTNTSSSPNLALRTVRFQVKDDGTPALNSEIKDRLIQPVASENAAPTDAGESYATTGNTRLYADQTVPADQPARTSTTNLLANANDPDGPEAALTTVNSSGAAHGLVVLATDGSFTYTPAVGYTGPDSFTYQVSDGTGLSAPSTVTLTVTNRVWYVDNSAAAGDGRSSSPFNSLEGADLLADAANDIIYVRYGIGGSAGYSDDVDLMVGQNLIGEGIDLVVGGITLLDVDEGSQVPLIDLTVNVDSGNVVRGLRWIGTRATPAIAGNAGDNGGTIMDVQINGARPGIELIGTTGDWTFWDVVVDVTAPTGYALRAENAGDLNFTANGTNAFGGTVAGAVKILTTLTTGSIDTVTAKPGSTAGIEMQNTLGSLTFGTVNLVTSGTALELNNADAITVGGGSVTSTGGNYGIRLFNSANSSITIPTGSLSGQAAVGVFVGGGSGALTYGGSIGNLTGGVFAVSIADHDNGEIRLTGPITSNGAVSVQNGAAPVAITNPNNVISSGATTAVSVTNQFVSPDGMTFKSVSTTTAADGLYLQTTSGGPITVTGSGTAGSGGTLNPVHLDRTTNPVELHWVVIVTGGETGVDARAARRLVLRDSRITGTGTGVSLWNYQNDGMHEYVLANNTLALSRTGPSNNGIELTNSTGTAPSTKLWIIGNVISGTVWDGISLESTGTATTVGQITDNMVSDYCETGILLLNQLGSANTDYTVTGNVVTDTCNAPGDLLREGLQASSGTGSSPGTSGNDGGTLCLDARGNALANSGAGSQDDYILQVVYEAKFFMPGLGSSTPAARFVSLNSADGPPGGRVQDTATPPNGGFFTGTCETPGAPPA